MNSIARLVSLGILLVLIIFLGMTFYKVITPYLMPLFLAAIVAVLSQPIFKYFLKKSKGNAQSSARLTTLIIIMLVMLPLVGGIAIAANQMLNMDFSANTESLEKFREKTVFLKEWMITLSEWKESVSHILDDPPSIEEEKSESESLESTPENDSEKNREEVNSIPEVDQPDTEDAETESPAIAKLTDQQLEEAADEKLAEFTESIQTGLTAMLTEIGQKSFGVAVGMFSGIASLLISLLIFVLALYYFLADGPALLEGTQKLIPMHMEYQAELLTEFEKVVRAIILATMAAAIAQGLSTAGVMWLLGSGHFFLFFALSTMFSMIPMMGTWIVWAPFAVYLFLDERYIAAIFLALFGSIVIGMMDNFIRTIILKNDAKLHPLLAFVSVLGGLQALGLWGIFIGPTVAACLYALIKIFNVELKSLSELQFGTVATAGAAIEGEGAPAVTQETEPAPKEKPDEKPKKSKPEKE